MFRAAMKAWFNWYGSKYGFARRYVPPQYPHVIEPFAGSAGYSTYYQPRQVTLIELDPVIAGVWAYLIKARYQEIMALPIDIQTVDDVHACQEAKDFIGLQLDLRKLRPSLRRTRTVASPANLWGEVRRARAAQQVLRIKHWRIIHASYQQAPDVEAHWHVDPPYVRAPRRYVYNTINHAALARWCLQRKGFLQVCESADARWLPFRQVLHGRGPPGLGRWSGEEAALQQGRTRIHFDLQPEGGKRDRDQ